MKPTPRRRIGRDGMLLAAMLCVPLLVLLGFRVAAAPSDPPPVEERPLQLTSETTQPRSATSTPTSSSPTTTKPTTTKPPTPKPSTPKPSTTRPTWTPTPDVTSRTQSPVPSYDDDDDDGDDDGDDGDDDNDADDD